MNSNSSPPAIHSESCPSRRTRSDAYWAPAKLPPAPTGSTLNAGLTAENASGQKNSTAATAQPTLCGGGPTGAWVGGGVCVGAVGSDSVMSDSLSLVGDKLDGTAVGRMAKSGKHAAIYPRFA